MAEQQAQLQSAIDSAQEATRHAAQARAEVTAVRIQLNEEEAEEIKSRAEISRAIISMVRKTRCSRDGLKLRLKDQFEEEKIDAAIDQLLSAGQMYTEGRGESEGFRAGRAQ